MTLQVDPENILAEGFVLVVGANGTSRVRMPNGHELIAFPSGKMRKSSIPLLPGEKVMLEISPYDLSRGRMLCVAAADFDAAQQRICQLSTPVSSPESSAKESAK